MNRSSEVPAALTAPKPSTLVAVSGSNLIAVTRSSFCTADVDQLRQAMRPLSRCSGGFALLHVLEDAAVLKADLATREGMNALLLEVGGRLNAAALVFPMDGFAATALRSMVTATIFSTGRRQSHKVFAAVEPAIEWLQTHSAFASSTVGLHDQVKTLREQAASQERVCEAADL
jgi:hypothetical protein